MAGETSGKAEPGWTPKNSTVVWELVLTFHDVFTLNANELGCTSAVEHEIWITDSEPFRVIYMHSSTTVGGGMHLTSGYVGCGCNPLQPIPLVQCHGTGKEEGWYAALMSGFL